MGLSNSWRDDALCAETGGGDKIWFAYNPHVHADDIATAKQICALCPVTAECLEYALVNGENYGIWGGMTAQERTDLRRKRCLPPPPPPETWHGTDAGARRHQRLGQKPCPDCAQAARLARREQRLPTRRRTHA